MENTLDWNVAIDDLAVKYLEATGLRGPQLASYNDFIETYAHDILERHGYIHTPNYTLVLDNLRFLQPLCLADSSSTRKTALLYPKVCIDEGLTYDSEIQVDITLKIHNKETKTYSTIKAENVDIGSIPTMVLSSICNVHPIRFDRHRLAELEENVDEVGGYFIINGGIKSLAMLHQHGYNDVLVYRNRNRVPKYKWYGEVYSKKQSGMGVCTIGMLKSRMFVSIPFVAVHIPIEIVLLALGLENLDEVMQMFPKADRPFMERLVRIFENGHRECKTQEDALIYIADRRQVQKWKMKKTAGTESMERGMLPMGKKMTRSQKLTFAKLALEETLLTHVTSSPRKIYYLIYAMEKVILLSLNRIEPTDRDSCANKTFGTVGMFLCEEFEEILAQTLSKLKGPIETAVEHDTPIMMERSIPSVKNTKKLRSAIENGKWLDKTHNITEKKQPFNLMNIYADGRKIKSGIENLGKNDKPRQWSDDDRALVGILESPEGEQIGMTTTSAVSLGVSGHQPDEGIITILRELQTKKMGYKLSKGYHPIFVNGSPERCTKYPDEIRLELILLRRSGSIHPETSIHRDERGYLHIVTTAGRPYRPLLVVEGGKLALTEEDISRIREERWDSGNLVSNLLLEGKIEYVDKKEERGCLVAKSVDLLEANSNTPYTHCEISQSFIYGVSGIVIPFANHGPSPRNVYDTSMKKQSVGIPAANILTRKRGDFQVMMYPQTPLVKTRFAGVVGYDRSGCGQNAIVAFMPFLGKGQEDSLILNQSSLDRGMFNTIRMKSYEVILHPKKKLEVPDRRTCVNYHGNYTKVDPNTGIVPKGTLVEKDDVLISHILFDEGRQKFVDKSVRYTDPIPAIVQSVYFTDKTRGKSMVHVMVCQHRVPIVGDKFNCAPGQKGVCALTAAQEDLPFSASEGVCPDIIMNPLTFVSRMTVGTLIEAITGKKIVASSLLNRTPMNRVQWFDEMDEPTPDPFHADTPITYSNRKSNGDATPFREISYLEVVEELHQLGFSGFGTEIFIDGMTGKEIQIPVFTGVVNFHRLVHQVIDKFHARSMGGRNALTRQAMEGRADGGGMKTGIMETDNYGAQGAMYTKKDRLCDQSDSTHIHMCRKCGLPAIAPQGESPECTVCNVVGEEHIKKVQIPYGTKLMGQELMGLNIAQRYCITEESHT